MTAKEMCDLVAQKLKEHDWRFRLRDFGGGEFAVDSDVSSKSGVFRFYELRFLFQRAEMRTIYYLPVKAPEAMRQAMVARKSHFNEMPKAKDPVRGMLWLQGYCSDLVKEGSHDA